MSNLKVFTATVNSVDTQNYLLQVLGEKRQDFVSNVTNLVNNDRNLQSCEPWSIINAAITATTLDLPLNKNLGYAYVIPYKNAGRQEAQYQMGYKGFIQLAMRSGQFTRINVTDVREGELKGHNRLTGDLSFEWDDTPDRVNKPIIGYVAYFRLTNRFEKSLYMTAEEIEQHATRYSQTYKSKDKRIKDSSKWTTDKEAMAKKTVLKLLLSKFAPMSTDMNTAIRADQSVQRTLNDYTYVDNIKDQAKNRLAEVAQANAGIPEDDEAEYEDVEQTDTDNNEPDKLPFDD